MWNAGLNSDDVLSEEIISKTEKWLKNLQSYPILMYQYVFFNQVERLYWFTFIPFIDASQTHLEV